MAYYANLLSICWRKGAAHGFGRFYFVCVKGATVLFKHINFHAVAVPPETQLIGSACEKAVFQQLGDDKVLKQRATHVERFNLLRAGDSQKRGGKPRVVEIQIGIFMTRFQKFLLYDLSR